MTPEEIQLSLPCSYCGAGRGTWCRKAGGGPTDALHRARFLRARKEGLLPARLGPQQPTIPPRPPAKRPHALKGKLPPNYWPQK